MNKTTIVLISFYVLFLVVIAYYSYISLKDINRALSTECEFGSAFSLNEHVKNGGKLYYYGAQLKDGLVFLNHGKDIMKVVRPSDEHYLRQSFVEYDLRHLTSTEKKQKPTHSQGGKFK